MVLPTRYPWGEFPDATIHASESDVKRHPAYHQAKAGDAEAAERLVLATLSYDVLLHLKHAYGHLAPVLLPVHADESLGINAIPIAMAHIFANVLEWDIETDVVQANIVSHTGADGFTRLRNQAIFEGAIGSGVNYVLIDDFLGQGGTIANLRGYVIAQGRQVLAVSVLTGKDYSARLAPANDKLVELRRKHGAIEFWWKRRFGFGFECLTASEVRYLIQTPTSERIVERLEAIIG